MAFPAHIFKAYDIRGLVEGELSKDLAYRVGRAFVGYLRSINCKLEGRMVVVGYDMRPTSISFRDEVIRGITDEGVSVVDIGLCSTPLFNFACANYPEHAGGIMVTASHNPAEFNGFKMTLENGLPVPGENKVLVEAVQTADFTKHNTVAGNVTVTQKNPRADYFARIFSIVKPNAIKPLKIVVDAANGMGAATFPELIKQLPQLEVEFMYLEPDGTFPNHEANPLKTETLRALQKRVIEVGADFGFALDGDADRIGLVDETGAVVDASYVGALIGLEVLKKHPGGKMLYSIQVSSIAKEVWEMAGGVAEPCRIGHALVKKHMKESGAVFAAELSLHVFFKDMYDVESTDLALLYFLEILSNQNKKLSEIVAPLKKYFHSGEINFYVTDKAVKMSEIEEKYKATAVEISHLDGLWMKFEWGWVSVRASNTESVLRLNLEAHDRETMEEKVKEFSEIISK